MYHTKKVVIVGGGPVGCLAALYLAQQGHQVEVYERRADLRTCGAARLGLSVNLSLSPRGLRALANAGVEGIIKQIALPMGNRVAHLPDGSIRSMPYGRPEWVNWSVSRDDLNKELIDSAVAYGVVFHFERTYRDSDPKAGRVIFETPNGGHETVSADLIIGADGAFSKVRRSLNKAFRARHGLFPSGYKEITIRPEASLRLDRYAIHIWQRQGWFLVALPNLDGSFRGTLIMPREGEIGFVSMCNEERAESFLRQELADIYPYFANPVGEMLGNPVGDIISVRCEHYCAWGKVLLIGDAAHAMVPFLGQGINAGFEDCQVLSRVLSQEASLIAALHRYNALRRPNCIAAAELSQWNYDELSNREASSETLGRKMRENARFCETGGGEPSAVVMVNFLNMSYRQVWRTVQQRMAPDPPMRLSTARAYN